MSPKGNILIDKTGHPRLTGFAPLMIGLDQLAVISSTMGGGTIPWMSPERFDPGRFGLNNHHPTKESDCYALGMVVYEVLSGQVPFAPCGGPIIIFKVLNGEHPERPQGQERVWFTDILWEMLKWCWEPIPSDRPSLNAVLQHLQGVETGSGDQQGDSSMFSLFCPRLTLTTFVTHRTASHT